ncbi:MAG: hypothetical protein GX053_01410 [Tissierella sp.]|nr:hypothetical protein [Tissierella sp.]
MSTAFERRVKRLREHVLSHNKEEIKIDKPIEEMIVEELREIAKERGFEGYSKLKRDELIELLNEGE